MNWYVYSVLAAILLAAHFLFLKKASLSGIPLSLLIMYMWLFSSLGLLGYQWYRSQLTIAPNMIWIVALAAVTALAGTYLLNLGVYTAPNPGYATAVGSLQVLIVLVSSTLLFHSEFSTVKVVGGFLVISGVVLLGL